MGVRAVEIVTILEDQEQDGYGRVEELGHDDDTNYPCVCTEASATRNEQDTRNDEESCDGCRYKR